MVESSPAGNITEGRKRWCRTSHLQRMTAEGESVVALRQRRACPRAMKENDGEQIREGN